MIKFSPELVTALAERNPVVALESTLITHGMPWPKNHETALAQEAAVRQAGALPATIAVIDGVARVGLTEGELEALARARGTVAKASRRDLSILAAARKTAGTTVAATAFLATRAGIAVFATGGIGGVHRGASTSFDVSADLFELARSPVAVVCAGAKSILDIPVTLEWLETHGVPVIGHGTGEFPAFYARESGQRLEHRCDTTVEIARVIDAHRRMMLPSAIVVANPVPEHAALPAAEIEAVIQAALRDADAQGIAQKDVTPFLLGRIVELSGGRSLGANVELIRHNAFVAGRIAVDYAALG